MDAKWKLNKKDYNIADREYKGKKPDDITPEEMPHYNDYLSDKIRRLEWGKEHAEKDGEAKKAKNLERTAERFKKMQQRALDLMKTDREHEASFTEEIHYPLPTKKSPEQEDQSVTSKKFNKKDVEDRSKYKFKDKGDSIEARAETGIEKYADKTVSWREMQRMLAEDAEKEKEREKSMLSPAAVRFSDTTFKVPVGKEIEDFDYTNMKRELTQIISSYVDPSTARISFNDKGEGEAYGRINDQKVVFATIDADHNVDYVSVEKLKQQVKGVPLKDTERDDIEPAQDEVLFDKPKAVDAFILVGPEHNRYFKTLDCNGNIYQGHNPYYTVDPVSQKADNIKESIKELADVMGMKTSDLVLVDGCSFITSKSGHQLGILDSSGRLVEDALDIKKSELLYDFARQYSIPEDRLDMSNNRIISLETGRTLGDVIEGTEVKQRPEEVEAEAKEMVMAGGREERPAEEILENPPIEIPGGEAAAIAEQQAATVQEPPQEEQKGNEDIGEIMEI